MAHKRKVPITQRDFEFITGNSFHRLMVEVARSIKSRRPLDSPLEVLAQFFLNAAVRKQTGGVAPETLFPRPWSYDGIVNWLVYYAEQISQLLEQAKLAPLLMETALTPYPLCKERGILVETKPDLIARRLGDSTLGIYDYKTVSMKRYFLYQDLINSPKLGAMLHNIEQLISYGAAVEHDVHEINEPVSEIGLIVVPRKPLFARNINPKPALLLAAPFQNTSIEEWRVRRLSKILAKNLPDE